MKVFKYPLFRKSLCVCGCTVLLMLTQFNRFLVSGDSMYPTLKSGQYVWGCNWFASPKYGQIVFAKKSVDGKEHTVVKRVIGTAGDVIEIRHGSVYRNSEPLQEDYVKSSWIAESGYWVVPKDSLFVLGDNRDQSLDSRYEEFGFVSCDSVISVAYFQ